MRSHRVSDDRDNASLEATTHPFLVRVWLEEEACGAHPATWRGHITHVPSGRRCYLEDLDDIATFIQPYLEEIGIAFCGSGRNDG